MPLFAACLAPAVSQIESPSLRSAEARFRVLDLGLYVEARVGQEAFWFLLDSGSPYTHLRPEIARRLPSRTRWDISRRFLTDVRVLPKLSVGGAELGDVMVAVQPVRFGHSLIEGKPVAGVLGYNVLRMLSVGLDPNAGRMWAWGAGRGDEARRALFGPGPGTWRSVPLDTDDLSYPRIVSDFSGMPRKPIVDLGAAMSALLASTRRTLGGKAAEGFPTVVSRPEGIRSHSTAFVPGVWMGDLRLPFTANVVGDRADELPDLFGWTALAPLGPTMLDFQGGEIDWAPQPPPEFLDTILTFYSVRLSERELIWGTRRVPLTSVRSIFGLPFDPSTRKLKGDKFNPMTAKEAKAAFFSCPPSADVVFERDGKKESFSASYRNVPRPARPVPLPRRSVFTVPGYYLDWEGKKMLLPPGPVWVPESKGRILAVGAVPSAPPSNPFGGYEITMIPDLLTLDREQAEFAGWRREPIPKIMAPGRAAPVPVALLSDNFYVVPKGHAFSSGRMGVVPPEGEGSFQLLRIPK